MRECWNEMRVWKYEGKKTEKVYINTSIFENNVGTK